MPFSKNPEERELQRRFYAAYLPRVDAALAVDDILTDYTDGIVRGNILEMKTVVSDLNGTLFQAIKYLSRRRVNGRPVPARIILVSLSDDKAWAFDSADYLAQIETVYSGSASRGNAGFIAGRASEELDLSSEGGRARMVALLREEGWTKIHLDESCIVGWATTFYDMVPDARKEDFLGYRDDANLGTADGEIRNPDVLADWIEPYDGPTNERFRYLMDMLNDFLAKKDLGAFFTPEPYVEKAVELVRMAIGRVPEGNDYIILDRCAGTGNLEKALTDEELSHCIVSTYEYFEYKVLMEILGDRVREVIPPIETEDTFMRGRVRGSDALSREFVEHETIKRYLDDDRCTVILYENPPFAEATSMEHQVRGAGAASAAQWKNSWVVRQMREEVRRNRNISSTATNDLGNAFIWSAFKYYLRQPTDSYVVFSPVKYWKAQHLIRKRFIAGFSGDRHHFHARKHSCVLVALWANEEEVQESFTTEAFDIEEDGVVGKGVLDYRRIGRSFSASYYDRRPLLDEWRVGILCSMDGTERGGAATIRNRPAFSDQILGYMAVYSSGFEQPDTHSSLLVAGRYDGNGFYLRRDNYLEKLPMFAASRYISYNGEWTERGRIMKSGDGAERYGRAVEDGTLRQWLLKCCLFCCLEYQNHMRSFIGSDGRSYRNELTLDTTCGPTAASGALADLRRGPLENELFAAWNAVLACAKETAGYDEQTTYGFYQIGEELNTHHRDEDLDAVVYDYPELNGAIKTLKALVKQYYLDEIVPVLFEYEFLK